MLFNCDGKPGLGAVREDTDTNLEIQRWFLTSLHACTVLYKAKFKKYHLLS